MPRQGALLTMGPSGATRVAGVIGHPVHHSLSPVVHNAAFTALELDWTFVAFDVAAGEADVAVAGMRALGLGGLSVTTPHKAAVLAAVDVVTPQAEALGAANCIAEDDGRLVAANTDGRGFIDSLRLDHGVDPTGWRVVVLGAGGAARAVIAALSDHGASEVAVINRTQERRDRAVALGGRAAVAGRPEQIDAADLVVNATSVGMGSRTAGDGPIPLDIARLGPGQVVADLVYDPVETPLLRAARQAGATPVDGVGMLVHQAGAALTLWTGREAPIEAMTEAARGALQSAAADGAGGG
jgi:shikimate dehydrogenase